MRLRLLCFLLFTLVPILGFSENKSDDLFKHWQIERSEKSISTKGFDSVEIINPFGNARSRSTSSSELTIFSVLQHHEHDLQRPLITTHKKGSKLQIEIIYPTNEKVKSIIGAEKRRLDLSFFIPKNIQLSIKTRSGFAEVKGHKGLVSVATESGDIYVKSKNRVEVQSISGNIRTIFNQKTWKAASILKSHSGNIIVVMPGEPNVSIDMETAGRIITDYSVKIDPVPGSQNKYATAKIGNGSEEGKGLSVKSKIGNITLFRMIEMIQAK